MPNFRYFSGLYKIFLVLRQDMNLKVVLDANYLYDETKISKKEVFVYEKILKINNIYALTIFPLNNK